MSEPICVMLVAAEASGDLLGAELAGALRKRLGNRVRFVGVGGGRMAAEGVASPFAISQLSVLGLVEGLRAYPRVRRRALDTGEIARRERPDVAILIDSWGFTLRVARRLRRIDPDLPLVKYVGPQVWASRPGRAKVLAAAVDRLLTIHAFDVRYFEAAGLEVTFVGNSTLARAGPAPHPDHLRERIGAGPEDPIVLVAPGSRPGEVTRMLPPLCDAVRRLQLDRPHLRFVVLAAPTVAEQVRSGVASWPGEAALIDDDQGKADAMAAATVALACSGSITTELAIAGCPVVVGYRLGRLTHLILKRLITTDYITLFNIAAGRMVAPELVQRRCTSANLAHEAALRLDHPELRAAQIAEQNAALKAMGRDDVGDPAERAADAVMDVLASRGRLASTLGRGGGEE